jgi:AraC-like DNA-binding protein/quercetin dioxygenase-like cupin family protein
MKTILQKVYVEENHSFACRTYQTPNFETNWHKHEEVEIIVITEGQGTVMIGDYVGEYKVDDVFFIASNLPHWFRKNNSKIIGSAVVAQFNKKIFGSEFLTNPELRMINNLLLKDEGYKFETKIKSIIADKLKALQDAKSYKRIELLLDILHNISITKQYKLLSQNFSSHTNHINPAIETIIDYSFKNYLEPITLNEVASIAKMSIPTFCRFFKKNIKKTYFEFLQEIRINHACKLLKNADQPIIEICYESGYNSWAHFSKQFKVVKKMTPSAYKKEFSER